MEVLKRILLSFIGISTIAYGQSTASTNWDLTIQNRAKTASSTPGAIFDISDVPNYTTITTPILLSRNGNYLTVRAYGNGYFKQFIWGGSGPFITFQDMKQSTIKDIKVVGTGLASSGFLFFTRTSSSHVSIDNCRYQADGDNFGNGYGFYWLAPFGADECFYDVTLCEAYGVRDGFKIDGSNILAPWKFTLCSAFKCTTGFNTTSGGSGAVFDCCGGTDTKTMFWVNSGYQGEIRQAVTERAEWVLKFGGDLAGGYGQLYPYRISICDARDTTGGLVKFYGQGEYTLDVSACSGSKVVELNNQASSPGILNLLNFAKKCTINKTGQWVVNGTGTMSN